MDSGATFTTTDVKSETLNDINELVEIKKELDNSEAELEEKVSKAETPEEIKEVIEEEIKKTEKAEEKIEEIVNKKPEKAPEVNKTNFTGFWNGMSYDY